MIPMDPPQPSITIDPSADLSGLAGTSLFYPCSGADLLTPMSLFAGKVATMRFVDRGYFRPKHQDTRHFGLDIPVAEAGPILPSADEWSLLKNGHEELDIKVDEDEEDDFDFWQRYRSIARLTETYHHNPSGREFQVIRSNDDARLAFDRLNDPLGIFFYRGDSLGEGGSGILWNDAPLMERVMRKLVNGGLLVTDGSNPGEGSHRSVSRHAPLLSAREMRTAEHALEMIGYSFKNFVGRRLTCIGYAGQRYGATLIWQVVRI